MSGSAKTHAAKRMARLAAVQALYQIALTQRAAADIIREFNENPSALLPEPAVMEIDSELFSSIVTGVAADTATLDEMIAGSLAEKFTADRLEALLRAILRAAAYELFRHGETPAGIIINDYVDVTHGFFNGKEPGLINAMLDKLGKTLRAA